MKQLRLNAILFSVALLTVAPQTFAQYKYTAADGSTTYSDRPPPPDAKLLRQGPAVASSPAPTSLDSLPFAVKAAAQKYPVVIYVASACGPCDALKQHLQKRGTPYAEKIIRNAADETAMKALGFAESSFPALSVGNERQVGFEQSSLDRLLDVAGYPKSTKLPAGYVASSAPLTAEPVRAEPQVAKTEGTTPARRERKPIEPPPKPEEKPIIRF
jgi:glutaredoxin